MSVSGKLALLIRNLGPLIIIIIIIITIIVIIYFFNSNNHVRRRMLQVYYVTFLRLFLWFLLILCYKYFFTDCSIEAHVTLPADHMLCQIPWDFEMLILHLPIQTLVKKKQTSSVYDCTVGDVEYVAAILLLS